MLCNVTITVKPNYLLLMMTMGVSTSVFADTIDTTGQEPYEKCGYCHEYDGNSRFSLYPSLASQTPAYIEKQLRDFRAGHRIGDMQATAELLSDQDIQIVARYFSEQTPRPVNPPNMSDDQRARAQQLFVKGDAARAIPACASCHGDSGQGMDTAPRLAGQHAGYLATQLRAFKTGTRHNDPGEQMRAISRQLSGQDIAVIASYLHALPVLQMQKITVYTNSYDSRRKQQ